MTNPEQQRNPKVFSNYAYKHRLYPKWKKKHLKVLKYDSNVIVWSWNVETKIPGVLYGHRHHLKEQLVLLLDLHTYFFPHEANYHLDNLGHVRQGWSSPDDGCQEVRVPLCTSWWSNTGTQSPGSLWKCFFQPLQWCSSWAWSSEDLIGPMEREGTHRRG